MYVWCNICVYRAVQIKIMYCSQCPFGSRVIPHTSKYQLSWVILDCTVNSEVIGQRLHSFQNVEVHINTPARRRL